MADRIVIKKMQGTILSFNSKKGFGFIGPKENDYRDIFLHSDVIAPEDMKYMKKGQRLIFDYIEDGTGLHAKNVSVVMDENTIMPDPVVEESEEDSEELNEVNE